MMCGEKRVGQFERTCRAKKSNRRSSSLGMIQEHENHEQFESEVMGEKTSPHESSVGWVNIPLRSTRSWDSDSSADYLVMPIRSKKITEVKMAGEKLPIKINGCKAIVWMDNGPPISKFLIWELQKTLGATGIQLQEVTPKDKKNWRLR